jgi:hypothetical protein
LQTEILKLEILTKTNIFRGWILLRKFLLQIVEKEVSEVTLILLISIEVNKVAHLVLANLDLRLAAVWGGVVVNLELSVFLLLILGSFTTRFFNYGFHGLVFRMILRIRFPTLKQLDCVRRVRDVTVEGLRVLEVWGGCILGNRLQAMIQRIRQV